MNNIEQFLLNPNEFDKVFHGEYHSRKIHKEQYDDRFVVLYIKNAEESSLSQEDYKLAGYLDIKDKVIYDSSYLLDTVLSKEKSMMKRCSFSDLGVELEKEIDKYIEKYSFDNQKKLMQNAREQYNKLEDWQKENYKKEVRKQCIEEGNSEIKLEKSYSTFKLANSDSFIHKNIYVEYLNNPNTTVEKYAKQIINDSDGYKDNKIALGVQLLIYYDKQKYLKEILENKNNEFKDLYINRKIYHSIEDLDAKTVNITIKYGNNDFTFKYDYDKLTRDLLDDDRGSEDWGVAYSKVSDFIKENSNKNESYRNEKFLFSHITSITYGKKELYHNDLQKDDKQVEIEEEFDLEK